ncbi:phage late control D family protein, partial [Escherichia coli 90.2281]
RFPVPDGGGGRHLLL